MLNTLPWLATELDKDVHNCHYIQLCVGGLSFHSVAKEINKRYKVFIEKCKVYLKIIIVYMKYSKQSTNH